MLLTGHRKTLTLLALLLSTACRPDAKVDERVVAVHTPRACAIDPARAFAQIYPAGDYEPGGVVDALFLREPGRLLAGIRTDTRALVVDSSQGSDPRSWRGIAPVARAGNVDVLLWPRGEACRLTADVERRVATSIGAIDERRLLVAGGGAASGATIPRSYLADLTTGDVTPLRFGIGQQRDRPTITPFGRTADKTGIAGALVAGGRVPDTGSPIDTAEVFVAQEGGGDFVPEKIAIEARADHAAVILRTGETLLVGGAGRDGLLRTMQIVDPTSRRAITQGVARLRVPRRNPTAIRLASGEILVGGGADADGKGVSTIEMFLPDASGPTKREIELEPSKHEAFLALPAGGALIVRSSDDVPDRKTVWVVTGDGALEAGVSVPDLVSVALFPGTEGAPVLWTGTRWLRWAPWSGTFQPIPDAPSRGPRDGTTASPDGGLVVWLEDDDGMHLWGFRHGARGAFQSPPRKLLADGPAYVTPDRLPGESARYDDRRKGLVLANGATALLADATFLRVSVDVESPSGGAPYVVLKDELGAEVVAGGPDCPLVVGSLVHVERTADVVKASVDRGPDVTCKTKLAKDARVSVAVRSGLDPAFVTSLTATRRP